MHKTLYAGVLLVYVIYGGVKFHSDFDNVQNHLVFFCQVADVWLCDANEAGGTAGWRLLLHRLSVLWRHRLCHRPWFVCWCSVSGVELLLTGYTSDQLDSLLLLKLLNIIYSPCIKYLNYIHNGEKSNKKKYT